MAEPSWQLMQEDRLVGTLVEKEVDMFWTDCHFAPEPGWDDLRPLFEASRDAWRSGDEEAAVEADEAIYAQGLVLAPLDGGAPLTEFLLRINGDKARFRY
ncbi:hypothetical protein [Streptomyces sp. NBC_00102]|uniref:hypothetical protein n=1 Tax=Streptomyces sp. NBC_00102 TaxID=2975652 RepID=UPI0022543588|nr:hypothetical protein [Streptomyces sp. NBC_00102]MCX5396865.1 hypothetical protein [Streptomyces sp. NBC_00102]